MCVTRRIVLPASAGRPRGRAGLADAALGELHPERLDHPAASTYGDRRRRGHQRTFRTQHDKLGQRPPGRLRRELELRGKLLGRRAAVRL